MEAQAHPLPSSNEQALATALLGLMAQIAAIRDAAHAVQAEGGSARQAFLSAVPEEIRPEMAAQWPMFAMMLGLPLT